MQSRILSQPMTVEQYRMEELISDLQAEASNPPSVKRQRIDDLPMTDAEYDEYTTEYNEWCDALDADRDIDADLEAMYQKALAEGTTQPDWTLDYMNGQTLVVVDETIIGRIWTRRDDDIFNTHYTHCDDPKDRWGYRKWWTDDVKCIEDLVNRYRERQAKQTPVQFIDGTHGYADPADVDFINWVIDRNNGGY